VGKAITSSILLSRKSTCWLAPRFSVGKAIPPEYARSSVGTVHPLPAAEKCVRLKGAGFTDCGKTRCFDGAFSAACGGAFRAGDFAPPPNLIASSMEIFQHGCYNHSEPRRPPQ
jgi:hypothetical protein